MFSPGQALTAWQLNRVGETASKGLTIHSASIDTIQGTFGTVFMGGRPIMEEIKYDYPFKVTASRTDDGGSIVVYVRPGTVNNRMPKIGGKYLDDVERPFLSYSNYSMTKKKIVALKVAKGDIKFFPDQVEVILSDDEETLTDNDNFGYLQLAAISGDKVDGKPTITAMYQYVYASQIVARAKPGDQLAIWAWSSR